MEANTSRKGISKKIDEKGTNEKIIGDWMVHIHEINNIVLFPVLLFKLGLSKALWCTNAWYCMVLKYRLKCFPNWDWPYK